MKIERKCVDIECDICHYLIDDEEEKNLMEKVPMRDNMENDVCRECYEEMKEYFKKVFGEERENE